MRVTVGELGMGVRSALPRAVHLVAALRAQPAVGQDGVLVAQGVRDAVAAVQPERRIGGVDVGPDPDAVVVEVVRLQRVVELSRLHRVDEHQLLGAAARSVPGHARAAHVEPELRVALDPHRLVERHRDPDVVARAVGVPVQLRRRGHRDPGDPRRRRRRHRVRGRRVAVAVRAARAQLEGVGRPVGEPRHREPGRIGPARRAVRNPPPGRGIVPAGLVPVLVARDARIRRRRVPRERHPRVAGRGRQAPRRGRRLRLRLQLPFLEILHPVEVVVRLGMLMGMGDLDGQTQLVPQLVEVGALIACGLDVHAHVRMRHIVMLQDVGAEERPVRPPLLRVVVVAAGTLPGRRMVVGRVAMLMGRMGVLGILLDVVPLAGIDMRVRVVELGMGVHSTLP